jgi:hypothetical protein
VINVERIEKSIENINGLLMDFQEAVDSLRETRELLYEIIESDCKNCQKEKGGKGILTGG